MSIKLIQESVLYHANKNPDSIAIFERHQKISYGQLRDLMLKIAAGIKSSPISIGDAIGIFAENGASAYVGILSALCADGVVFPINPGLPEHRISWMICNSKTDTIICTAHLAHRFSEIYSTKNKKLKSIFILGECTEIEKTNIIKSLSKVSEKIHFQSCLIQAPPPLRKTFNPRVIRLHTCFIPRAQLETPRG